MQIITCTTITDFADTTASLSLFLDYTVTVCHILMTTRESAKSRVLLWRSFTVNGQQWNTTTYVKMLWIYNCIVIITEQVGVFQQALLIKYADSRHFHLSHSFCNFTFTCTTPTGNIFLASHRYLQHVN